jgi:hypothetical protein
VNSQEELLVMILRFKLFFTFFVCFFRIISTIKRRAIVANVKVSRRVIPVALFPSRYSRRVIPAALFVSSYGSDVEVSKKKPLNSFI